VRHLHSRHTAYRLKVQCFHREVVEEDFEGASVQLHHAPVSSSGGKTELRVPVDDVQRFNAVVPHVKARLSRAVGDHQPSRFQVGEHVPQRRGVGAALEVHQRSVAANRELDRVEHPLIRKLALLLLPPQNVY